MFNFLYLEQKCIVCLHISYVNINGIFLYMLFWTNGHVKGIWRLSLFIQLQLYSTYFLHIKVEKSSIALYNTDWYSIKTLREKKMFLNLLSQSQMPAGYSAYGLFYLSFSTFIKVILISKEYHCENNCFIHLCRLLNQHMDTILS